MKNLLLFVLLTSLAFPAFSQDCEEVNLKTDSAIIKAETCVTSAADFILSKPLSFESTQMLNYKRLVVDWMEKTTYTFNLNPMMVEICSEKKNSGLLGIYLACLAKAAIANKTDFTEKAVIMFIAYISDPANGVKETSKTKKLLKAKEDNKLTPYL